MLCELLNVNKVNASDVILKRWNSTSPPYHTSIEIKADKVYSVSSGKVVCIRNEANNTLSVSILVNKNQLVRYCNLTGVDLYLYSEVSVGDFIGTVNKYVSFEYCTEQQGNSKWPVRFENYQFFKQDPSAIVDGKTLLIDYKAINYISGDMYDLTDDSPPTGDYLKEISNVRSM